MSPIATFLIGLVILGLFLWYFITENSRRQRIIGTALTVLIVALCLESAWPLKEKMQLGLDLRGGSSFLIRLVKDSDQAEITPTMQDKAVEVIRERIDRFGVSEPVITPQGSDRILVQIPGLDAAKISEARDQLQRVAKLEFRLVYPNSEAEIEQIEQGQAIIPAGYQIVPYKDTVKGKEIERRLLIKKIADLSGKHVSRAGAFYDQRGYGVHLNFDSFGGDKFGELTKQAFEQQTQLAIVLDGDVISAPNVPNGPIYGGSAEITGRFTEQEARGLASALENPLETPVVVEEERSVSSTLGGDSINTGITAILIGFALVLFFVLVYYRFAGLVAIIGLVVNMVLLFGLMSMFGFVLTLPGIAGIVLVIGMAIDSNILIYERIREELKAGASLAASIQAGYDKAFSAIFDSNITTLITSAILFWKASGSVRGFAVSLTVGIAASMFSALLVTRNVFNWAIAVGLLKQKLTMLHLISSTRYDFLGKRRIAVGLSLFLTLASIALLVVRGDRNFGIDFKGGDQLVLHFDQPVEESQVRKSLEQIGFGDAVIQKQAALDRESLAIRSPFDTGDKIAAHLQKEFPAAGFAVEGLDKVGPVVGKELLSGSLVAIALGLVAIFVYLAFRFETSFAIGTLVALVHDLIICLGVIALIGHEFSLILVGAILTVAGYSINDTIIVFDRIREGLLGSGKAATEAVMNRSINETLSRTILTSSLTLLSLFALYFYGGPVLEDFAICIIVGIVIGTYSSIFVASPLVLWWSRLRGKALHHEVAQSQERRSSIS